MLYILYEANEVGMSGYPPNYIADKDSLIVAGFLWSPVNTYNFLLSADEY